jgi:MSHA biogenesis protein MshO
VTLTEMVVVIAITGIIAAAVALFIRRPVEGYVDAARRAELTDIADTALRRITRDLRTALPNSIRVDGTSKYIEFFQTSGGGRFRADVDSGGSGDPLNFLAADDVFDVIGPMPALAAGDSIVIYNLTSDPALATANVYAGDNREAVDIAKSTATTITLVATKLFPYSSPGRRFQVVKYPVTYGCESGVLRRYWGYTIQLSPQPAPPTVPPGSSALLAADVNVAECDFSYSPSGPTGRTGVVSLALQVEQGGEKVRLFQQVHVSNVP